MRVKNQPAFLSLIVRYQGLKFRKSIDVAIQTVCAKQVQVRHRTVHPPIDTATTAHAGSDRFLGSHTHMPVRVRKIDSVVACKVANCDPSLTYIFFKHLKWNAATRDMTEGVRSQFVPVCQQGIQVFQLELDTQVVVPVHQAHRDVVRSPDPQVFQNGATDGVGGAWKIVEAEGHNRLLIAQRNPPGVQRRQQHPSHRSELRTQGHNYAAETTLSCTMILMMPSSGTSMPLGNTRDVTPSLTSTSCIPRSAKTLPDGALRGVLR